MELLDELRQKIVECLQLDDIQPEAIDPEAPLFVEGLGLDSIDALELVVMLEKHYQIKVADMEVGKRAFRSVSALAAFVREKTCPASPSPESA